MTKKAVLLGPPQDTNISMDVRIIEISHRKLAFTAVLACQLGIQDIWLNKG